MRSPRTPPSYWLWISMIGVAFSNTYAYAADHRDRFPISLAELEAKAEKRFVAADVDQSGTLDLAEFESAKLPRHAKKHRNKWRRAEGKRQNKGDRGGKHQEMREAVRAEMFALMDTDADGTISEDEFTAAKQRKTKRIAMKRAMFKHLDKDQDEILSADEILNPARALRLADEDGDGFVTRQELRANRSAVKEARRQG